MIRSGVVTRNSAVLLFSLAAATTVTVAAQPVAIHPVVAQAAAAPTAVPTLADGEHRALVLQVCGQCHPIERVVAQRRSAIEWDDMIAKMVQRGAKATEIEQDRIYQYLVTQYGRSDQ